MQQTVKATSPAATVLLEVAFARKCQHPVIFGLIFCLCLGSVLVKYGSSDYDATTYGMVMMVAAVISGAFKYVMAHAMIKKYKDSLGVLAFTFWVEVRPWRLAVPYLLHAAQRISLPCAKESASLQRRFL